MISRPVTSQFRMENSNKRVDFDRQSKLLVNLTFYLHSGIGTAVK